MKRPAVTIEISVKKVAGGWLAEPVQGWSVDRKGVPPASTREGALRECTQFLLAAAAARGVAIEVVLREP